MNSMALADDPARIRQDGAFGPRLLFVPVSGAFGMGEYARSLNLALACAACWPNAKIHFILSGQAKYAAAIPFAHTVLPSSPTFHTPEVVRVIEDFAPQAIIFDNAGRTAQLAAGRRAGARLVYISARPRQRRKAFRLRWMRMLDEHWIAYPRFMAGSLSILERGKLRWMQRPQLRYLDCILPTAAPARAARLLEGMGLKAERFVLTVPGGGTGHPRAGDAVAVFAQAARLLGRSGIRSVFVAPGGATLAPGERFTGLDLLPLEDLLVLLRAADGVLTNGGDTLIQAIACAVPSVAVPIAADQPARISKCVQAGAARAARMDAAQMSASVAALFHDATARAAMREQCRRLDLRDGLRESVDVLASILGGTRPMASA